jgi:hypothetical protein
MSLFIIAGLVPAIRLAALGRAMLSGTAGPSRAVTK